MASARIKIQLKILLLLGIPIGVLASVFVAGLYMGSERWQQSVLAFESTWLHWELPPHLKKMMEQSLERSSDGEGEHSGHDVNENASSSNKVNSGNFHRTRKEGGSSHSTSKSVVELDSFSSDTHRKEQEERAGRGESSKNDSPQPERGGGAIDQVQQASPSPNGDRTSVSSVLPAKSSGESTLGEIRSKRQSNEGQQALDSLPNEGSTDYRSLLALPTVVRIKVIVDQEFIAAHRDWIDDVQRTINIVDQQYQRLFGIELRLHAVGSWAVATAGLSSQQLLEDLRARPRESADVLLGMTARPLDFRIAGKADQALIDHRFNGAYAVVYSDSSADIPHLFGCLHEIGHLFGAVDIEDAKSLDYQRGSFMSYAVPKKGTEFWIDDGNRRRIIARKGYPFWPESLAMQQTGKP